jgi:hypothetical protein
VHRSSCGSAASFFFFTLDTDSNQTIQTVLNAQSGGEGKEERERTKKGKLFPKNVSLSPPSITVLAPSLLKVRWLGIAANRAPGAGFIPRLFIHGMNTRLGLARFSKWIYQQNGAIEETGIVQKIFGRIRLAKVSAGSR